eukprot:scpid38549/ scgid15475/ Protein NLRC5
MGTGPSGLGDTAENDTKVDLPREVEEYRERLVERYLSAQDTFPLGMLPDGFVPTVQNIFIDNLVMLPKNALAEEFNPKEQFASCFDLWRVEHVFSQAGDSLRLTGLDAISRDVPEELEERGSTVGTLIFASTGCGKTFIMTKAAPMKWANGLLWKNRLLVVARELHHRDVQGAGSLRELLGLGGIGVNPGDQQVICDYIRAQPACLCLVLDGLDEASLAGCSSFVRDILQGTELRGIRLIVTSRLCADIFGLSQMAHFYQQIELAGFRRDDIEPYIKKVLNAEKAGRLIGEVVKSDYLCGMMATPFIAKETCMLLHHSDSSVPRCVADVFTRMLLQIAKRADPANACKFDKWGCIPKRIRKLILEIGKFAFYMLRKKQLIFSEENLQEQNISKEAIRLGLFVACEESDSHAGHCIQQWRFSHSTIQEYLAALYWAEYPHMTEARLVRLVESLGANSPHLQAFWVLLCAQLNAELVPFLLYSLLTTKKTRTWQGVEDLLEFSTTDPFPANFIPVMCDVLEGARIFQLAEELLCGHLPDQDMSGTEHVKAILRQNNSPSLCDAAFFEVLLLEWQELSSSQSEATPDSLLQALGNVSPKLQQHCEKSLAERKYVYDRKQSCIQLPDSKDIDEGLHVLCFRCYSEFIIHQEPAKPGLPVISALLSSCQLDVDGRRQPAVHRSIDSVVQHHSGAVTDIWVKKWSDKTASQFPSSLAQCSEIKKIYVRDVLTASCRLNDVICSAISCSHRRLEDLDIYKCSDITPPIIHALALKPCEQLQCLSFIDCCITERAGIALAESLAHSMKLRIFRLHDNPSLGNLAVEKLCDVLVRCRAMVEVVLLKCGLTSPVLPHIAKALQQWKQLDTLQLHGNDFTEVTESEAKEFVTAVDDNSSHNGIGVWLQPLCDPARPSSQYSYLVAQQSYSPNCTIHS